MRYMDMSPAQLREAYWTERNGLHNVGELARSVTSARGRSVVAGQWGRKLDRFDLICNVARKRRIDLLAPGEEPACCERYGPAHAPQFRTVGCTQDTPEETGR